MLYGQNLISDLTGGTEVNVRILSAGWLNIVQLDLFQGALTGGCLLGLGSICRETLDELLQLLNFLFLLPVGFLHLLNNQLAGLYPEIVVSGIQLNLAIVDICNLCADLI